MIFIIIEPLAHKYASMRLTNSIMYLLTKPYDFYHFYFRINYYKYTIYLAKNDKMRNNFFPLEELQLVPFCINVLRAYNSKNTYTL